MKIKEINNYQLSPVGAPIAGVQVLSYRNDVLLMTNAPDYQNCGNGVFVKQVYYDNKANTIFLKILYANGINIVTDITQIVIKDIFAKYLPTKIVIK